MDWRRLWAGYCDFYGAAVSDEVTEATWRRILEPASQIGALIAILGKRTVGIANYVLHPFTWSDRPTCLLEDLYVSPEVRSRGIGARLIEVLVERGRAEGWARVYWHTSEGNARARRLYDRFCFADGFVRYTIALRGSVPTAAHSPVEPGRTLDAPADPLHEPPRAGE